MQRFKQMLHEELELKVRADVTVDEICKMLQYNDEDIKRVHQNLADIRSGKWKQIKDKHKKKDEDE